MTMQEANETFAAFATRWRKKSLQVVDRPSPKEQNEMLLNVVPSSTARTSPAINTQPLLNSMMREFNLMNTTVMRRHLIKLATLVDTPAIVGGILRTTLLPPLKMQACTMW